MLAHTHDDVGWVKTVDQYYSGAMQREALAEVHLILTTAIEELQRNPSRKFTYVEMKFFTMWYERQDQYWKDAVR
jgi:lysosomal alpha-mannosidase